MSRWWWMIVLYPGWAPPFRDPLAVKLLDNRLYMWHMGWLIIFLESDDDDDARRYGSLMTPRRYIINDDLRHHFSLIFSNSLMTPPLGMHWHFLKISKIKAQKPISSRWTSNSTTPRDQENYIFQNLEKKTFYWTHYMFWVTWLTRTGSIST